MKVIRKKLNYSFKLIGILNLCGSCSHLGGCRPVPCPVNFS